MTAYSPVRAWLDVIERAANTHGYGGMVAPSGRDLLDDLTALLFDRYRKEVSA